MLRLRSAKARANIRKYCADNINEDYLYECSFGTGIEGVREAFKKEKVCPYEVQRCRGNYRTMFQDWLEGLPSAFHYEAGYWNAALIVGKWLKMTESEIEVRFDADPQAMYIIYRNEITDYFMNNYKPS